MSYKSNDRVSGNRLSIFASQLWGKIKNTFALKNHNHEYIVSGGGVSEGAKYFKLFDINADSKAKPKEINVITRDSADINMSGSLIIRTSAYNKNEVWASFVVNSVKGGNDSAVDGNVPFSYSINDNGIISVYGYCDMFASISWSVRCGSSYITPSNTEIESSVYEAGSRFSISLLNNWYSITSKPSTFTPSPHSHDAATTSASGFMSSTDKGKLNGIADNANNYSLPTASKETLGGVKVGTNLSIDGNGVLSATDTKYTLTKAAVTELGELTNNTSGNAAKATNANNLNTKTMLLQGGSSVPWYNVVEIGAAFANYRDVTATIGIQLKIRNSSNISSNYFCTANIGCRCNTGTEILSAFCIVDGTIDLSDKFDLYVTASYYNGNAMVKLFVHVKDTNSKNYYQVNCVNLCKDDFVYSILYNDRSQSSKPTGTKTADAMWYDDITGNAASATKAYAITNANGVIEQIGGDKSPVYIDGNGHVQECHLSSGTSVDTAKYADNAGTVKTHADSSSTVYYLTFVNSTGIDVDTPWMRTSTRDTNPLTFQPSTGTLKATKFDGAATYVLDYGGNGTTDTIKIGYKGDGLTSCTNLAAYAVVNGQVHIKDISTSFVSVARSLKANDAETVDGFHIVVDGYTSGTLVFS